MTELLGDNKMFFILMQVHILTILAQLDRVPTVRLFETRETYTRDGILLGGKKAFERRTQTISQHLDGCGRNMFIMSLESTFQIILTGEGAVVLILLLDGLKHLIIQDARLFQALHEQMGLLLIHEKSVFVRPHRHILWKFIRIVNRQEKPVPCLEIRKAQVTPIALR